MTRKKYIYGALISFVIVMGIIYANVQTKGAPVLTYVYSNSMSPLIKVNDAFLVWPVKNPDVGDIIMYRPVILKAPYITHRIIAKGEKGYITKGDNSPYEDQESEEPEVTPDRIIGKVVTINDVPLIIPGLGKVSSYMESRLGNATKTLSFLFLILGVITAILDRKQKKKRKSRNRWRLRHVYKALIIVSACTVIISIYLGSQVSQIEYLVSKYPGSQGDHIQVGKEDQLVINIKNKGIFPVWIIVSGIEPLSVNEAPDYLWIRSGGTVLMNVKPQYSTGRYQGYVQHYHYPVLLPRTWILWLHNISPFFANLATGMAMAFWVRLLFLLLSHVHGLEDWIPLKSMKDKLLKRRIKRTKARLFKEGKRL